MDLYRRNSKTTNSLRYENARKPTFNKIRKIVILLCMGLASSVQPTRIFAFSKTYEECYDVVKYLGSIWKTFLFFATADFLTVFLIAESDNNFNLIHRKKSTIKVLCYSSRLCRFDNDILTFSVSLAKPMIPDSFYISFSPCSPRKSNQETYSTLNEN